MALPEGIPERTLGWAILDWCSRWLVNPDARGGIKGAPWVFLPDQARFILWLYAVDERGEWIYRRAYRERAKGSGKSPMVAAIACAEFLGPAKFSHFDDDGNPVGVENEDAVVWLSAISQDGCRHTYRYIMGMLMGPAEEEYNLDIGRTRTIIRGKADNKIIETITASYRSHQGPQPTFVIMEETQNWVPGEHGQDLFETIFLGITKTNGRVIEVTNSPQPGENSVAEETKKTWSEIESGDKDDAEGLLYDTFGVHVDDIYDIDQAMPALKIIYQHAPWMNLKRVFRDIKDRQVREMNARRFYFNETISPHAMWIAEAPWNGAARPLRLNRTDLISLGFRIKKNCCAIAATRLVDQAVFILEFWEKPQSAVANWEVPYATIDKRMRRILDKYNPYNMVASPENFQDIIGRWSVDYEGDVEIEELWLSRNKQKFVDAVELFESAVHDQRLIHDGNPDLTRHVMSCFAHDIPQGRIIRPETDYSQRYIVAAEAAILSFKAAQEALLDGALKPTPDRTLFTF